MQIANFFWKTLYMDENLESALVDLGESFPKTLSMLKFSVDTADTATPKSNPEFEGCSPAREKPPGDGELAVKNVRIPFNSESL